MKENAKQLAAGLFAAIALAMGNISSPAQPTNLMLYNFDTDQVTATPYNTAWGNWYGGYFQTAGWISVYDASNNPNSGCMYYELNCNGSDQYVLNDGINPAPSYSPLDLTIWTNLSFDIRYDADNGIPAIRTNTTAAGINGSLGPGSEDFGYMRVGSVGGTPTAIDYSADWYYYFAISATNGAGQLNTNWNHINVDLQRVSQNFSDLSSGLNDILIGMDGGAYGNNTMVGQQWILIDNIQLSGIIPHYPPPTMSIEKAIPALRLFGGSGQYGRAQLQLVDTNESWIGGTFPVSYSFTALDNATSPGGLDYHIHLIQGTDGYSGADYTDSNVLWLQIISGVGTNTACVANVSWKTNTPAANPNQTTGGAIALMVTNPVLAGTWTLTFLSDTNGTLTAPGTNNVNVPFSLALADADAIADFRGPLEVRFGIQNNGNTANGGIPHDWANITVTNTLGAQINEDFTKESSNQLNTTIWDLGHSDGAGVVNLVPTNAPYWVKWNVLGDGGFALTTANNLNGPWHLPEFYNNYADGSTNTLPSQTTQAGNRWNLMLPQYLPTVNGSPGGAISPTAYFRLMNPPPSP